MFRFKKSVCDQLMVKSGPNLQRGIQKMSFCSARQVCFCEREVEGGTLMMQWNYCNPVAMHHLTDPSAQPRCLHERDPGYLYALLFARNYLCAEAADFATPLREVSESLIASGRQYAQR